MTATTPPTDWLFAMLQSDRFALTSTHVDGVTTLALEHPRSGLSFKEDMPADSTTAYRVERSEVMAGMLVAELHKVHHLELGETMFARLFRCDIANQLIEVISNHGRCVFHSHKYDRIAQMGYDGSVFLIDEKSGKRVELRNNGSWEGFGHGGTMRDLVTQMRDFVMKGRRIDRAFIGLERANGDGNVWGYPPEEMAKCRAAAFKLPIIAAPSARSEKAA